MLFPDSRHADSWDRREWLRLVSWHALGLGLLELPAAGAAAEQPPPAAPLAPLNRFPRMVQEHFVGRVRAAEREGLKAKAALKTREDAERYVKDVRQKIRQCFGPFPEKTPLNARVTA